MDDDTALMELWALLTGFYAPLVDDPKDRALNRLIASAHAVRLTGKYLANGAALLRGL